MRFQLVRYAFVSFVALTLGSGAFAQDFRIYAGEFLQLGVGGRSLALGGAAIAFVNDASVGYWNPAGLANINYPSITGMHESRFAGAIEYDVAAVAAPLGALLGVVRVGLGGCLDARARGFFCMLRRLSRLRRLR